MNKSKLNEAIGYLRTATTMEDNENNSLSHQKKEILKWAKENNIQITKFYSEVGSGFSGKRPILDLMIAEINEKVVTPDALIVKSPERISRNSSSRMMIDSLLEDKGIELVSTDYPHSHLLKTALFLDASNSFLSEINSKRIHCSLNITAEKDFFTGGSIPYGYASVPIITPNKNTKNKTLVINPIEAAIVKELFNLATNGIDGKQLSLGGIARALNQQKLMRRGTLWDYRKVSVILKNPIYHGERLWGINRATRYKSQPTITINAPSIISKEQFLSAQKELQLRTLNLRGSHNES